MTTEEGNGCMDLAALIVSIVALVVSSASVGWNIYSWRGSGARLRVDVKNSYVARGDENGEWLKSGSLGIYVANRGRLATTIWAMSFQESESGGFSMNQEDFLRDYPPKNLQPGEVAFFGFHDAVFVPMLAGRNVDLERMKVQLFTGHGEITKKFSKEVRDRLNSEIEKFAAAPDEWKAALQVPPWQ